MPMLRYALLGERIYVYILRFCVDTNLFDRWNVVLETKLICVYSRLN